MAAGERPLVGDYAPPVGRSPAAILIVVTGQANCRSTTFLRARRGVATKYLDNYLRWFHLAGLQHAPTPRACLNAAIGPQLKIAIPT
jgi:hypothetical protein